MLSQLKSYGGYLTYNLELGGGGGGTLANPPDVVLMGSDLGRDSLYHYLDPRDRPRPGRFGGAEEIRVRFWEGQWVVGPRRNQASRPEIMTALNNVTHLLVR